MRSVLWVLVLVNAALAGCASDDDGGGPADALGPQNDRDGSAAGSAGEGTGEGAGSASSASGDGAAVEREYTRTDGAIETRLEPTQLGWVAEQTISITNDFAGAQRALAAFSVPAGGIHVEGWSRDAYEITLRLQGRGATEMGARGFIEHMIVEHLDLLFDDGQLQLATKVVFEDYDEDGVPFVQFGGSRSADVFVRIPSGPGLELTLAAASADLAVTALEARALGLSAASGDITVDARAEVLVADAASGDITIDTDARDVRLDTASGDITASLTPTGSGSIVADTASGDIMIMVPGDARYGYDVIADTASGSIVVDLPDTETVRADDDDFRHVRTTGFSSRDVQVRVVTDTASGDITVQGR
jgi:hypothetical protein